MENKITSFLLTINLTILNNTITFHFHVIDIGFDIPVLWVWVYHHHQPKSSFSHRTIHLELGTLNILAIALENSKIILRFDIIIIIAKRSFDPIPQGTAHLACMKCNLSKSILAELVTQQFASCEEKWYYLWQRQTLLLSENFAFCQLHAVSNLTNCSKKCWQQNGFRVVPFLYIVLGIIAQVLQNLFPFKKYEGLH